MWRPSYTGTHQWVKTFGLNPKSRGTREGLLARVMTHLDIHVRNIIGCNIKNRLEELKQGQENQLGDISQLRNDDFYPNQANGSESGEK